MIISSVCSMDLTCSILQLRFRTVHIEENWQMISTRGYTFQDPRVVAFPHMISAGAFIEFAAEPKKRARRAAAGRALG